jgi:hypothetical protein
VASTIKIKRSSVAGKVPTTSDIATGELALNTKDQKLYSSNGTVVFPIGAKQTNLIVSGNTSITNLIANGSLGTAGYALKTNGTSVYWDAIATGGGGGAGLISYSTKQFDSIKGSDVIVTNITAVNASAYLQVANAVATYATKASPTTSGVLGHTGRATISTNLAVSGNTALGGLVNINYTGSANSSLVIQGTNTKGGAGYHDFLMARNGGGGTNPNKWFRINSTGGFEIINSAYTATVLLLTDSGGLSVPGPIAISGKQAVNGPAFRAYPASGQTITSGSLQKVNFGSESYDTNNNFASSRFTPTVEGYYQLNATVRLDGSNGTGECMIVIYKNGSEYSRGWNSSGTQFASNFWSMSVSDVIYANGSTDYFEIYIQQGSGGDRTTTAYQNISYFSGCMVRGA